MPKDELTLQDVVSSMNEKFNMVFSEFGKIDKQLIFLGSQMVRLQESVLEIQKQQKEDSEQLTEIQGTLESLSKAVDTDAVTIIDHERRIIQLEEKVA